MQIKKLTLSDAEQAYNMLIAADRTYSSLSAIKEMLSDKKTHIFGAFDGDKIVGISLCYELLRPSDKKELLGHGIDILPELRGRGIGTKINEFRKNWARENGFSEIWTVIRHDNIASRRANEKSDAKWDGKNSCVYTIKLS